MLNLYVCVLIAAICTLSAASAAYFHGVKLFCLQLLSFRKAAKR